ncbi:MAG: twin-arginine translocase subunit TatC [Candidatus Latescibacteria bacterium]|nr:twin-arginine translocase subunit TatC [Candidatus Latescibacterota bacterium]
MSPAPPQRTRNSKGAEMPFLDHLEELRWRLLKSIAAIIIGAILSLVYSKELLGFLTYPYENAVISMETAGEESPLGALQGMFNRWFKSAAAVLEPVSAAPAADSLAAQAYSLPPNRRLQALKPTTYLMLSMQIALMGGLVLALPVVFYQFWRFVAPGLMPKERRLVVPIVVLSVVCFLIGAAFAYAVVLPTGLLFFLSMEPHGMTSQWAVEEYISFVLWMLVGFGVVFELPVLALFLSRVGLINADLMRRMRRYAIVLIFIISAILTPSPDPISQALMAVPLMGLYEISILICRFGGKKRPPPEPDPEPDEQ